MSDIDRLMDGKPVARWAADEFPTRDAAYAAEFDLIRREQPYLNKAGLGVSQ